MRFVLATLGSHGDVNPYLAVARALAARGHEVRVATHAHHRALVEGVGVSFHALRPDYGAAWGPRVMHPRRGARTLLHDVVAAHVRATYDDLRAAARGADLLLSHPLTLAAPLVAGTTGVPWASAVLAPTSLFSLGTDMPLLAPELAGVRRRAPWLYRAILRGGKRRSRAWVAPVDELRRAIALRVAAFGPAARLVGVTELGLADVLLRRGRLAAAESVYVHALGLIRPHTSDAHVDVRRAHEGLAAVYAAWGRPRDAARYRALARAPR